MNEKEIERIMNDPNTWEWDGCTYSEIETKESWEEEFLKNLENQ